MKRLHLIMAMFLCFAGMAGAQKVEEPEFELEPYVLNEDQATLGEALPCENAYVKAKAGASMYIVGIGKVKSYSYVDGVSSPLNLSKKATLVISLGGKSPRQTISINRFEVLKKKRRFQTGSLGTFTGADAGNDAETQNFRYKKYGEKSISIPLEGFEAGEYCLSIINENTNSKSSKVYTFTIK